MESTNQSSLKAISLNSVKWTEIRGTSQTFEEPHRLYLLIKRLIDIVGSLTGLILLMPLLVIVAVIIKLYDPKGGVFFRQYRNGRNSQMFKIIKFRSMIHNADEYLKKDKKLYEKYIANNYKLESREDPRITPIGRFIRKTSIDELPQLINVLIGDMSLVGPRPIVQEEILEYGEKSIDLLSVKPGLTGYWQINGRSTISYPERTDMELYYVYNQSLPLDLRIMIKTVWIVLLRIGAY